MVNILILKEQLHIRGRGVAIGCTPHALRSLYAATPLSSRKPYLMVANVRLDLKTENVTVCNILLCRCNTTQSIDTKKESLAHAEDVASCNNPWG
jgi:hypothetical protein